MSTGDLKSIDKLRDTAFSYAPNIRRQVNMACDEIEQEITERFMELPVDADGVPIRLGDVVAAQDEQPFEVRAFQYDTLGWFAIERLGSQWNVNQLHHVKPRTIEDVLYECFHDCMYKYPTGIEDIIGKYADELRSMWMIGEPSNELMNSEVVGE